MRVIKPSAFEVASALFIQGPWVRDNDCVMCGADLSGSQPHEDDCPYGMAARWVEGQA